MPSRRLSATLFSAAALAFLLPFGAVSCEAPVEFTGLELATFHVDPAPDAEIAADVESDGSPVALIALAATLLGLVLVLVGRRGSGLFAAAGFLALQLLLVIGVASLADVDVGAGYVLAVVALGGACIAHLVQAVERRRLAGRRYRWYVAGVSLVLLPATLLWFVALADATGTSG